VHFDFAGGEAWITSVFSARNNFTANRDHKLAPKLLRFGVCCGCVLRIEYDLSDAVAIA
jgi:hypothetical protein